MKLLALCTGLVLLAIANGLWLQAGEASLESRLWLRLLDSVPIDSGSLLAARGQPAGGPE